jgi:hypothetical protein
MALRTCLCSSYEGTMKTHGGVETWDRPRLTLCGARVPAEYAPFSQPVSNITCGNCRRVILSGWKRAIEERAHARGPTVSIKAV